MISRREFLHSAAAASAAAAMSRVLHAPSGGGKIERMGLELYTVRDQMAANVESTLERVAAIGYQEVEFAGYFGHAPARLRETLDRLRLAAPACHVDLADVEHKWNATANAARSLGHRWVVVASVDDKDLESVASLRALAARFNAAGRRAHDAGLRYGFHNHSSELKPVHGSVPLDVLLSETEPALVDFEMDLYWLTRGGGDALSYFAKYPGRFHLVHAKDTSGPPAHEMRDVGAGTIDWKAIFAHGKQAGIEHVFVEHDEPVDAYASAAASYRYLKSLEF
ncbi:MAG TPA: sugar phosphate isomerase/epimerase [Gemmatimonadaceae bacterium]|nr:sugar phosphate isomerase/epimerase [Gemmatimonadaceae bacterium]